MSDDAKATEQVGAGGAAETTAAETTAAEPAAMPAAEPPADQVVGEAHAGANDETNEEGGAAEA